MPTLPTLAAGCILASLVLYALTGGADFGGGVWELLNRGPRAEARKRLIAHAIGPVWETNHIWIIVAVVVLFTAFPKVFAVLSTALVRAPHAHPCRDHPPGFRLRVPCASPARGRRDGIGGAASSRVRVLSRRSCSAWFSGRCRRGRSAGRDIRSVGGGTGAWLAPFPLSVGGMTLASCAYLAAVYLILEADDPDLKEDFRRRAMGALALVSLLSAAIPFLSRFGAPEFHRALTGSWWSVPVIGANALAALGSAVFLARRAYPLARACAASQVTLLLAGWGMAQYPYLVRPDLPVSSSAASPEMLRLLLVILAVGGVFLFPAIYLLFRVFKKKALFGG